MYGTPRLAEFVASGEELIGGLLASLAGFTGAGWEQEDDITLVTLRRSAADAPGAAGARGAPSASRASRATSARRWSASPPWWRRSGSSRAGSSSSKTAVAEATMNAIEHGNDSREELPVDIEVAVADGVLVGADHRRGRSAARSARPRRRTSTLKLAGLQKPRGWGLFLIENMVDEIRVSDADGRHTVELVLNLEGGGADGDR